MKTENIVLEHLRALRADVNELKSGQREILEQMLSQRRREHAQDTDLNSHNRRLAHVEAEVERIKRRLDLVD